LVGAQLQRLLFLNRLPQCLIVRLLLLDALGVPGGLHLRLTVAAAFDVASAACSAHSQHSS
jgi:hypothetical protein